MFTNQRATSILSDHLHVQFTCSARVLQWRPREIKNLALVDLLKL